MSRSQLRKKYLLRNINPKDIHWKNIPFICKFVNGSGALLNRYQSRLPGHLHKKMVKAIKVARHMGLLAYFDEVQATDKMPLTNSYNEFIGDVTRSIDPQTGIIRLRPASIPNRASMSEYNTAKQAYEDQQEELRAHDLRKNLVLDVSEIPSLPDNDMRDFILAQNFLLKVEKNQVDLKNLTDDQKKEKECYDRLYGSISNSENLYNLTESFFSEKGYKLDEIKKRKSDGDDKTKKTSYKSKVLKNEIDNLLKDIEDITK